MHFIRINGRYVEFKDGLLCLASDVQALAVRSALREVLPRGRNITVELLPEGMTGAVQEMHARDMMGHGGYVVASDGITAAIERVLV